METEEQNAFGEPGESGVTGTETLRAWGGGWGGDRMARTSKPALEVCFPSVTHRGPHEATGTGVAADELRLQGA